ncbi:PTS sugar transporter subunit IIA [Vibrio sp. 10N.286.49.C2]|uniref:DUF3389 domain-containing protein n=1 Tax=unclassified Vibrio TaxID=2614977 RepID=UPI000C852EE2|nr:MULTISPECIES: DUF3389 domain-containing protein [unclassified Vibrio]PMH34777.1 PTS sugar transporter subunit IIA [Vibrio sp. 10N.286.49.C2]PMH51434.1 PTS sugar transporter subunit IIA [Vibrio sp. 10N.286.49.B1]PMH79370.1 PTS sugar transporter subunit IIA [Vibrio sp. 10N.286.48.B7]
MTVEFSGGKVLTTPHEIVVRLTTGHTTLQAQVDAVQLILPACVISANGSECKWSIRLDNEAQIQQIANETSIEILSM